MLDEAKNGDVSEIMEDFWLLFLNMLRNDDWKSCMSVKYYWKFYLRKEIVFIWLSSTINKNKVKGKAIK